MKKNNLSRNVLMSGIFGLASFCFLNSVCALGQAKAEEQGSMKEESALKDVLPAAESFEAVREGGQVVYYKALDADKNVLGVVFKSVRRGYSSDIVTMAGMDTKGVLVRVKVMSLNETPGLGSRAAEPLFLDRFKGKPVDGIDKSVDAVTGATITSSAIIDSVRETGMKILEKMKNG
jgi:Na+-translocating ferredoxin:NAD+ oxidoreductase subunit G